MDLITAIRAGLTVLTLLMFAGIVWWAYGGKRKARFDLAAQSLLRDEDDPPTMQSRTGSLS